MANDADYLDLISGDFGLQYIGPTVLHSQTPNQDMTSVLLVDRSSTLGFSREKKSRLLLFFTIIHPEPAFSFLVHSDDFPQ